MQAMGCHLFTRCYLLDLLGFCPTTHCQLGNIFSKNFEIITIRVATLNIFGLRKIFGYSENRKCFDYKHYSLYFNFLAPAEISYKSLQK